MDFIPITSEKLKVLLTREDLQSFHITYESMDYGDPHTRRVLQSILELGKEETDFSPRKSRLFIEVLPTEGGGCVLYFTCLPPGKQLATARDAFAPCAVVFAFPDAESLTEAAVKTYRQYSHRIYKSSLYRLGDGYRLIIYPLDYADQLSVSFLGEFAPKTGEGQVLAAWVEEHGALLIQDNALEVLSSHLG